MNLIIGGVLAFLVLALVEKRNQGITATLAAGSSAATPPPVVVPPNEVVPQFMVGSTAVDGAALNLGVQSLDTGLRSIDSISKAVPIIGGVISAIGGALLAAHQRRAQEATSENSAVDNFIVKGLDPGIAQIVNAYNRGQLDANSAIRYLDQLFHYYWAEVTPHIQPGRNGCNGGASIGYSIGKYVEKPGQCSGSWGAACCVGGYGVAHPIASIQSAIMQTEQTGQAVTRSVPPIYPSKYSRFSRGGYQVTVKRPR